MNQINITEDGLTSAAASAYILGTRYLLLTVDAGSTVVDVRVVMSGTGNVQNRIAMTPDYARELAGKLNSLAMVAEGNR